MDVQELQQRVADAQLRHEQLSMENEMLADFLAADAARKAVTDAGANFSLATCGWTLGPMLNRSCFLLQSQLVVYIEMTLIRRIETGTSTSCLVVGP